MTLYEGMDFVFNFGEELRAAIDAVDPNLHSFFSGTLNSFIRLEIVVLFRRSPAGEMSAAEIAEELGWPEDRVADELHELESSGVLEQSSNGRKPKFRLSSDPQVADLVNKFGFLYANRRSRLLILRASPAARSPGLAKPPQRSGQARDTSGFQGPLKTRGVSFCLPTASTLPLLAGVSALLRWLLHHRRLNGCAAGDSTFHEDRRCAAYIVISVWVERANDRCPGEPHRVPSSRLAGRTLLSGLADQGGTGTPLRYPDGQVRTCGVPQHRHPAAIRMVEDHLVDLQLG